MDRARWTVWYQVYRQRWIVHTGIFWQGFGNVGISGESWSGSQEQRKGTQSLLLDLTTGQVSPLMPTLIFSPVEFGAIVHSYSALRQLKTRRNWYGYPWITS